MSTGLWLFSCQFCGWHVLRGGSAGEPTRDRTWAAGPGTTEGPSHGVQFYASHAALVRSLANYLASGWAADGVGIIIATAQHREMLATVLTAWGLNPAAADGRLIQLDAAAALRLFMRDDVPDDGLFQQTIGALVREHAHGAPLRAFGEMVDLLWAEGNSTGALLLEQLWEGLQQDVTFSLLCSYDSAHLDAEARDALSRVHSHVAS